MKYIDLTHKIHSEMLVSPFDTKPTFKRVKFLNEDHYNDTTMTTTMHIGTHIDAPSHMLNTDKDISGFEIDSFIGKGVFLDYENQKEIGLKEEYKNKIEKDSIVLIYTNMEKVYGTDEYYYEHPQVSEELCDYLIEKQIKVLALDFFSPDSSPSIIHKKLLSNDILIVENISNANLLKEITDFTLYLIPIRIKAEGAFIRAFAQYD